MSKLHSKFKNALEIKSVIDFPYGYINHVIDELGGFTFGPKHDKLGKYKSIPTEPEEEKELTASEIFFPTCYLKAGDSDSSAGDGDGQAGLIKRKLLGYKEKGLHLLFFYEEETELKRVDFDKV